MFFLGEEEIWGIQQDVDIDNKVSYSYRCTILSCFQDDALDTTLKQLIPSVLDAKKGYFWFLCIHFCMQFLDLRGCSFQYTH